MEATTEKKTRRTTTRRKKEPPTKAELEAQIKELEKKKRLIDLDIEKLKIELEFMEDNGAV
ncbi:MAG: hypothetical protein J5I94_07865 [Phaeodactylibacter sp.]|nr:hypothetical protein [Phaeodactylibacter sp.]